MSAVCRPTSAVREGPVSTELHVLPASGEQAGPGYAYFVAFVAAVGGFLFGYDLLIINGAQSFLRDYLRVSRS